jgi:tetratricopeptide (TPR) repeat protein
MQGQFEQAQSCFNNYIQLHPQDPTGYFWLGRAAQQNGQSEQAARYYAHSETLAKQLGMDSDQLRVNLGNTLLKLNYFKEAIYDYERAIRINDKNIFAHFNLGKALLLTGQSNRALSEISKASELGYTDPSASLMRALALKNLGQLEESKREAQRFLDDPSVSPTSPLREIARSLL